MSESRVTWPTSVPILVFLGLSVLDLGQMFVTDRQTSDVRHTSDVHHPLMSPIWGVAILNNHYANMLSLCNSHRHISCCSKRQDSLTFWYRVPLVLWHCWLTNRKGIRPVKNCVLVCWWWRFDWNFVHLIAPVVIATSIILSTNKIQNGDISVSPDPGPPGKWPSKRR